MSRQFVDDLIGDILVRLRLKDVLRFRCLSKPLCNKIDSRAFTAAHLRRSIETKTHRRLGVFVGDDNDAGYIGFDLDDEVCRFEQLDMPYDRDYEILCSLHGLILFGNYNDGTLVLWKPFTRRLKKLPNSSTPYRSQAYIGLGYDSTTHDYKVVILDHSKATIFHVATNTWSEVAIDTPPLRNSISTVGVFANGSLHWLSCNNALANAHANADADANDEYVYSFDISQQKFVKILPPISPQFSFPPSSLDDPIYFLQVLGGRLFLGVVDFLATLEFYEPTDDNWRKLYTIDLSEMWRFHERLTESKMESYCVYSHCKALELSKDGNKILLQYYTPKSSWMSYASPDLYIHGNLCWYDLQSGTYRPVAIQHRRGAFVCWESLDVLGSEFDHGFADNLMVIPKGVKRVKRKRGRDLDSCFWRPKTIWKSSDELKHRPAC